MLAGNTTTERQQQYIKGAGVLRLGAVQSYLDLPSVCKICAQIYPKTYQLPFQAEFLRSDDPGIAYKMFLHLGNT